MEQENSNAEVKMEKSSSYAFKGIVEVFYDPASLFKKIKDNHTILIPYIVLFAVSLLVGYLLKDIIMQMQLDSPEFQEQMKGQQLPESAKSFMEIMTVVGMGIGMLLTPLITASLALFFGNFVMGGKAKFKTIFSMMIYCEVLYMIGNLLLVPMVLAKGDLTTGISLGFLVADQGVQSIAFTALSKISLFHIWEIIVAGIGLSIIYDFSRNKGYMLSVLSIGLLSIMHIGAAALGAMFK